MKLQQLATDSVKRRGFHEDANIPDAARNLYQMEYLLESAVAVGRNARRMRKNGSVPAMPSTATHTMRNPLLMAQTMRFLEEVGELAEALLYGNPQSVRGELADVQITMYNIASVQEISLDNAVRDKLTADELRGYMHGERVTTVTEVTA